MPFQGFICHITHEALSPEACLACAQAGGAANGETLCPFTPPLIRGLIRSNQPRGLLAYSATELTGCPRKTLLKEHVPYWLDPAKAYWAFRGQLAHAILEQESDQTHALLEQRFYAQVSDWLITGQPDVVYPDTRKLVDYKTTKQVPQPRKCYTCPDCAHVIRENPWAARKGTALTCFQCGWTGQAGTDIQPSETPPVPYAGHIQQVNVYAWLLAQNGIAVETAEILYLDMSTPLRLPAPLWEPEDTLALIQEGLARLTTTGPDGLPYGVQDDAEANWECRYCPVTAQCARAVEVGLEAIT